jgi:hypothetical protein
MGESPEIANSGLHLNKIAQPRLADFSKAFPNFRKWER